MFRIKTGLVLAIIFCAAAIGQTRKESRLDSVFVNGPIQSAIDTLTGDSATPNIKGAERFVIMYDNEVTITDFRGTPASSRARTIYLDINGPAVTFKDSLFDCGGEDLVFDSLDVAIAQWNGSIWKISEGYRHNITSNYFGTLTGTSDTPTLTRYKYWKVEYDTATTIVNFSLTLPSDRWSDMYFEINGPSITFQDSVFDCGGVDLRFDSLDVAKAVIRGDKIVITAEFLH